MGFCWGFLLRVFIGGLGFRYHQHGEGGDWHGAPEEWVFVGGLGFLFEIFLLRVWRP